MIPDATLRRIEAIARRPERAVIQARLWGLHADLEREWDGADPGIATDLQALRLAANVFEAIDSPLHHAPLPGLAERCP